MKNARRYVVCKASQLPPGKRTIITIPNGTEIGVFNVDGELYALKNVCPHHGAPLCLGVLGGTSRARFGESGPPRIEWVRSNAVIRCPWHGWEFDLKTGVAVFGPGFRTATYPVQRGSDTKVEQAITVDRPGPAESYPVGVEDELVIVEVPA